MGGFDSGGGFSPITMMLGAAGLSLVAVLGLGLAVFWRRAKRAARDLANIQSNNRHLERILAAQPDGLFTWNTDVGQTGAGAGACSARLAILLNLERGRGATLDDVLNRFDGENRALLESACLAIGQTGHPFEMTLEAQVRGQNRLFQISGRRVETGGAVTGLLWVRDVSAIAGKAGAFSTSSANAEGAMIRVLLDAIPFPVWLRGDDLEPVLVNRATDPAGLENTHAMAARALERREAVVERHFLARPDAENNGEGEDDESAMHLLEVTEVPLPGGGTIGYAIDHSSADEMEAEFVRHLSAHEQTLENLTAAIAIFDDDTHLQFFNSAFAALWHLDPDWLETEPSFAQVLDRLRIDRRLPEHADFRRWREEQTAQFEILTGPVESMMHRPDGITVRAIATPYPLGGLMFVHEDVTDRLALERSYNTLIAVQRETLDNLHEGIVVFGADGRLKLHNPSFSRMWNIPEGSLRNEPHISEVARMMLPLLKSGREDAGGPNAEALAARLMRREAQGGRVSLADGSWLEDRRVPLPDGGILLSYLDVTDSARAEQALLERAQALHEVNQLKSEFISNVSYEISTPLNTIMGFADILRGEHFGEMNPRQTEYADGIMESSRTLTRVVGDIIDFASLEAGTLALELDSVDVHGALTSALGLIRETARRRNLKIEFDCAPDIGWIIADEKRLKQIAFNLLNNAVNATTSPGLIRLEAGLDDDAMTLAVHTSTRVKKEGIERKTNTPNQLGMLDDMEPPLPGHEPFEKDQTDSGLGLSLVRRFAEMHGGELKVRAANGRHGQTITCRLPAGNAKKKAPLSA